jgi:uncharacterized protein YciI
LEFDTITVSLLKARRNLSPMEEREVNALQDAHMDFLASLHETGALKATGPFTSPPDCPF